MTLLATTSPNEAAARERVGWEEFVFERIQRDWRPGEFSFEHMHLIPDPTNPLTAIRLCRKEGCGIRLNRGLMIGGRLCPTCAKSWKRESKAGGVSLDDWLALPRERQHIISWSCAVPECGRMHARGGLCKSHAQTFRKHPLAPKLTVEEWIERDKPAPFAAKARCVIPICRREHLAKQPVCDSHWRGFKTARQKDADLSLDAWIVAQEPAVPGMDHVSYASMAGIPLNMLPTPLRWEFLYAIQQRDLDGRSRFHPVDTRTQYRRLLESGRTSVVGLERLGLGDQNSNLNGMTSQWQAQIDDLHAEWTGATHHAKFVRFSSLELTRGQDSQKPGLRAGVDLSGIQTDWIFETVLAWLRAAPRNTGSCYATGAAWTLVDEVLRARGTGAVRLGRSDMAAIVKEAHSRWPDETTRYRHLLGIDLVLRWARSADERPDVWNVIPANFYIDPQSQPARKRPTKDDGEAFRFVPQPIVDWMMDHLPLYERQDEYATVEAQAMIYLLERTGRRTGEMVRLRDDCVSFDSAGKPYLEWPRGKPPYGPGKRIPLHQETFDLIVEWKEYKEARFPNSKWLFPSRGRVTDHPYPTTFLSKRVGDFAQWIADEYPYESAVIGATGNLIHFDITDVDAYSFRHAFAQRLADATDASGRSTTSPQALQEFMGHSNFNTTMAYFEVTSQRLRKALDAVPPRRLNFMGKAVEIDRERDAFTQIAVSHGSCSEPQNVISGGQGCPLDHACESCPFFLVDPLEKDGMTAKREALTIKLERARITNARQHILSHYIARIEDCERIIEGIDEYIDSLPQDEKDRMNGAIAEMADVRRRATAPRKIDIRRFFKTEQST